MTEVKIVMRPPNEDERVEHQEWIAKTSDRRKEVVFYMVDMFYESKRKSFICTENCTLQWIAQEFRKAFNQV